MKKQKQVKKYLLIICTLYLSACGKKNIISEQYEGDAKYFIGNSTKGAEEKKANEAAQDSVIEKAVFSADTYLAILEDVTGQKLIAKDSYFLDVMKYQVERPCSFLAHILIPEEAEFEQCQYRNIAESDQIRVDDFGVEWRGGWDVYVVDSVLDKYIRDYGGEDVQYHMKVVIVEQARVDERIHGLYGIHFYEVYSENMKLLVIYNRYVSGIVNVLIEGDDTVEMQVQEFITYAQYDKENRDSFFSYYDEKRKYCMLVNPESMQKELCYRNVDASEPIFDSADSYRNVLGYYIADVAIDKYIRDYCGSDAIYRVSLLDTVYDEKEGSNQYVLEVRCGEEVLHVTYADNTFLVNVEVVSSPFYGDF